MKTYECFKERQQQELCHCESSFLSFVLQTYSKSMGQKFPFFQIIRILSVPNFCKFLHLGHFCIEM